MPWFDQSDGQGFGRASTSITKAGIIDFVQRSAVFVLVLTKVVWGRVILYFEAGTVAGQKNNIQSELSRLMN